MLQQGSSNQIVHAQGEQAHRWPHASRRLHRSQRRRCVPAAFQQQQQQQQGGAAAAVAATAQESRRLLLQGAIAAGLLTGTEQGPAAAAAAAAELEVADIYAEYAYQKPQDVLPFIYDNAPRGDAEAVLRAIDAFAQAFPMYRLGAEKGRILEAATVLAAPSLVVELGSFQGYGALRMARNLKPGGRLVCVEANPDCVGTMEGVLRHAGLRDRVVIEQGLAAQVIPGLAKRYGAADMLFEDHCKACYKPDLQAACASGLVRPGTLLVADNVIVPGAPDLLALLQQRAQFAACLLPALYEYEQKWSADYDGTTPQDAMAVALVLGDEGKAGEGYAQARERLEALGRQLGIECKAIAQPPPAAAAEA